MMSLLGSLLNIKSLEESGYSLLGAEKDFEVRDYHRVAIAKVCLQGSFAEAFQDGKKLLMDYLVGNNLRLEKIPSSQVFFQYQRQNVWEIGVGLSFLRVTSEIPMPVNRLVRIEEISPKRTAVLKCSGISSEVHFNKREVELLNWIEKKCWQKRSEARLVHNHSLVQLPFMRDKEILIDVI